jgi:hypothetical protein
VQWTVVQWKQRIQIAQQLGFEIHLWDDLTWTIDYDANETSPLTTIVWPPIRALASPPHAKRS